MCSGGIGTFARRSWWRTKHVLPGRVKAVIGAHRVVSEEFLTAVRTSFCAEGKETPFRKVVFHMVNSMRLWAPTGLPHAA
jgi:hypothetical protein